MAIQDKSTPNGYTHIGKTALKERGWTDKLVKQYLPEPCKTQHNIRHAGGPKRSLYSWERVLKAELEWKK